MYILDSLSNDEKVLYLGDVHWIVFARSAAAMLIAIVVLVLSGMHANAVFPCVLLILFSIFDGIFAAIKKSTTEFGITTKRVVSKSGLIGRKTTELIHKKVESLEVEQSIAGRILGYGTLYVIGTGGNETKIECVSCPMEFRRRALLVIDKN